MRSSTWRIVKAIRVQLGPRGQAELDEKREHDRPGPCAQVDEASGDAQTDEVMDGLTILEKLFDMGTPGLDELLRSLLEDLYAATSDCELRLVSEALTTVRESRELRVMYDRLRPGMRNGLTVRPGLR